MGSPDLFYPSFGGTRVSEASVSPQALLQHLYIALKNMGPGLSPPPQYHNKEMVEFKTEVGTHLTELDFVRRIPPVDCVFFVFFRISFEYVVGAHATHRCRMARLGASEGKR